MHSWFPSRHSQADPSDFLLASRCVARRAAHSLPAYLVTRAGPESGWGARAGHLELGSHAGCVSVGIPSRERPASCSEHAFPLLFLFKKRPRLTLLVLS